MGNEWPDAKHMPSDKPVARAKKKDQPKVKKTKAKHKKKRGGK